MSDQDRIRNFEYRPYRMQTGFAVEFVMAEITLQGLCRDVSDAGIRAEFDGSIEVGDSGLLILRHPSGTLSLEAQAAYTEKCQVGLIFRFQTTWEHQVTAEYIAQIARLTAASQLIQFP
jgi:hypothetical protein